MMKVRSCLFSDCCVSTLVIVRQAFEQAGIEFIDENGGGPGVRLRKRQRPNQIAK